MEYCVISYLLIALGSVFILIYAHYYFFDSCHCLSSAITSQINEDYLDSDGYYDIIVYNSMEESEMAYQNYVYSKETFGNSSYMNLTSEENLLYRKYSYSSNDLILNMPLKIRMDHNVTHYALFIPRTCFSIVFGNSLFDYFLDFDIVMINQIIRRFKNRNGFVVLPYEQTRNWLKSHYNYFDHIPIIEMIKILIFAVVNFALASVINSLIIKFFFMSFSVLLLVLRNFLFKYKID